MFEHYLSGKCTNTFCNLQNMLILWVEWKENVGEIKTDSEMFNDDNIKAVEMENNVQAYVKMNNPEKLLIFTILSFSHK